MAFDSRGVMARRLQSARAWSSRWLDAPERGGESGPVAKLFVHITSFARTHVLMTDGAIAAVVFVFGLLASEVVSLSLSHAVFTVLLALPLVWRRRAPITVFLVIAAVAFVQWLSNVQLAGDVALLVALFTVADDRSPRAAIGASIILECGAVLATARWTTSHSALRTLALLSGVVVAALVSGIYVRARRAHVASLEERAQRLEIERDQHARLAAAAERARIAREMHDIIAHSLAVVIALVGGASAKLRSDPDQASDALASVSDLSRQALDDTRRLLSVLRDEDGAASHSPQPGVAQIADLVQQVSSTGIVATLHSEGAPTPLATGLSLAAYRIVQEAITNALKYAQGATVIAVVLVWSPGQLEIRVSDDGRCTPASEISESGFGLAGMRERAALYGGSASAQALGSGGWVVSATLPTDDRGAS
jgi:signal transduction histidine kinase